MQIELLRLMSPEQKLAAAEELRRTTIDLLCAGVRARRPGITPDELRLEVLRLTLPEPLYRAAYRAP